MSSMHEPFDEIRITRLETGYLTEYWREGICQFKLFDSEQPKKIISIMMSKLLIQVLA